MTSKTWTNEVMAFSALLCALAIAYTAIFVVPNYLTKQNAYQTEMMRQGRVHLCELANQNELESRKLTLSNGGTVLGRLNGQTPCDAIQ